MLWHIVRWLVTTFLFKTGAINWVDIDVTTKEKR
jgi:hypothetical protein